MVFVVTFLFDKGKKSTCIQIFSKCLFLFWLHSLQSQQHFRDRSPICWAENCFWGLKEYLEREETTKSWDSSPENRLWKLWQVWSRSGSTSFGDADLTQAPGSARVAKQHDSTGSGHKGVKRSRVGSGPPSVCSNTHSYAQTLRLTAHLIHNHNGVCFFMPFPGKSNLYLVGFWVNHRTKSNIG